MNPRIFCLLALFAISACKADQEKHDEHQHEHEHADEHEHHEGEREAGPFVRVDREMLRDLRITTSRVVPRPGGEGVETLGELRVNQDAYAEITAPIAARVLRVFVKANDRVAAGKPLVELESVELGRARAELLSARARLAAAEQTHARKKLLVTEKIAPERELEEAQTTLEVSRAELAAAEAGIGALAGALEDSSSKGARFTLSSPIAGTVLARNLARGQMIEPASTLFRVGDLSRLWIVVHAFERDALRVQTGAVARVGFPALPGRAFTATVSAVGREVETGSRTIPIQLELENESELLRPGMSVNAFLPLGEADREILSVPIASVQRLSDGWHVFVPKSESEFEARAVGRGRDLGGEVEIISGLSAGEVVVVDGAFLLKAEAQKASGEGESHAH